MSAISLKSITGITSITTPAGVDNIFTVHTNDTTERFRVDQTGNLNIAGIVTASQGVRVPHGSATTNYVSVGDNGALRFWATTHSYADIRAGNLHFRNNSLQNILEIQQDKDIFLYGPSYFLDTARFDQTVTIADTITHHGDTDTKIRFPAADTITFETSGNEAFRIDSNRIMTFKNKIIIDDGSNGHLFLNNTSSENTIHSGTTGFAAYKNLVINAAQHTFKISNTEKVRIDSSGNVGIDEPGTILAKLHVVGGKASGTTYNTAIFAGGQNSTQGSGVKLYLSGCENDPISRGVILESIMTDNSNAHRFSIKVGGSSAAPIERFRIDSTGQGHFYGNQSSAPQGIFGFRYDKNNDTDVSIENLNNSSVNNNAALKLRTNHGNIQHRYFNNGGFYIQNSSASGYLHYFTNNVSRLYIDSSGNVNINNQGTIATTNGNVGKRLGIKSTLNNIIIGETTNASMHGIIIESRVTGRSGGARCSQLEMGDGVIRLYTAPSGGTVLNRFNIGSDGTSTFDVGAPSSSNKIIGRFQAESSRKLDIVWHDSGSLMGFDTPGSHSYIFKIGGTEKVRFESSSATISGTTDGVLNLTTTDSRGSFIRFQQGGTSKCWVGSGQGLSLGNVNDLGLRATHDIRMQTGTKMSAVLTNDGYFAAKGLAGSWVDNTDPENSQFHQFTQTGVSKWVAQFQTEHHAGFGVQILGNSTANSEAFVVYSKSNNSTRFRVLWNGNCANANNSFGSLSDISIKENIVDANSQWDDIKAIKVRNFNLKNDPDTKMLGVVAQEVETVSPKLVWEDREGLKGVSYSVLYMKAIKALQEAQARIETLETKVAALESS